MIRFAFVFAVLFACAATAPAADSKPVAMPIAAGNPDVRYCAPPPAPPAVVEPPKFEMPPAAVDDDTPTWLIVSGIVAGVFALVGGATAGVAVQWRETHRGRSL